MMLRCTKRAALLRFHLSLTASSERLRELDKKTAEQGIKPLLKVLEHKYASELGVMKYLKQLKTALVNAILVIHSEEQKEEKSDENLFGKIEYTNIHGSVFTNYRMIQPGALHRANGGYLLLDVDQLIEQPFVWDTLKLAIKSQRLRMDLLGSRDLYYTLQDYDDEFDELFRVLVDFDLEIPVTRQALFDFVGKVRAHLVQLGLLGLKGITANAMCRLVEYSLRMAEHKEKLSAHFAEVIELVNEAYYFCQKSNADTLELDHLKTALSAKKRHCH